jgi:sterol desaturase/sphingolipid hydroxylase (fatty acid hydroxylase superfamily)
VTALSLMTSAQASTLPDAMSDPVVYAIPAFVVFLFLEIVSFRWLAAEQRAKLRGYEKRDAWTSLSMGIGSLFVTGASRIAAFFGYVALYELTPLRLDSHRWYTWVIGILGVDLLWYLYHRGAHRVRLLWAGHQAHHNSLYFNYSTALRQKWNPWFELLAWVPLPLLGLPPWMIYTSFSINLIFQFFVHTERVGKLWTPVEFVFNTPSHHRVHHASDKAYIDKNYAGIFIIWDRLLGTFKEETFVPTYGLTKNIEGFNPFVLQYHEYAAIHRDVKAADSWRERLGYVLGPPMWQPPNPEPRVLAYGK